MRRTRFVDELIQDAHYACRSLLKHPSFVVVTVLSLALGIGANSAIFSLLNKVLLESLPVARPDQLVILNPQGIRNGWIDDDFTWSYPAFLGLQKSQQVFTDMFAERTSTVNFSIDNATQRATESIVSGNYFQVLGVRALLGRILSTEDDRQRDAHSVAVLTYGFWMDQLGGRRDIVGHAIRLNGHPFTVVGVTEKGFNGLEVGGTVDIIVPISMLGQVTTYGAALDRRSAYIFNL